METMDRFGAQVVVTVSRVWTLRTEQVCTGPTHGLLCGGKKKTARCPRRFDHTGGSSSTEGGCLSRSTTRPLPDSRGVEGSSLLHAHAHTERGLPAGTLQARRPWRGKQANRTKRAGGRGEAAGQRARPPRSGAHLLVPAGARRPLAALWGAPCPQYLAPECHVSEMDFLECTFLKLARCILQGRPLTSAHSGRLPPSPRLEQISVCPVSACPGPAGPEQRTAAPARPRSLPAPPAALRRFRGLPASLPYRRASFPVRCLRSAGF